MLTLALSYGSRRNLKTVKELARKLKITISPSDIDENYKSASYTHNLPDVDLLIRTSGEQRLSNFYWQIAYAELHFTWVGSDYKGKSFEAVIEYQQRERRFGKQANKLKISISLLHLWNTASLRYFFFTLTSGFSQQNLLIRVKIYHRKYWEYGNQSFNELTVIALQVLNPVKNFYSRERLSR